MLEVRNLRKRFGKTWAVDGLNFTLTPGRIYAFVGPNGAGKTTTMRMIATLDEPTAGTIHIDGKSVQEEPYAIRRMIGYMPDHYGIYPDLTIRDYLEFYARAYSIPRDVRQSRINNIMEFTGLDRIDGKKVDALSKGMMQRLNMGRGLLNDPKILVLDEPAAGLDPRARIELRFLLKQLAGQGRTIFISSHILTELAEMCDEMLIIDKGRQVMFGTVDQIQAGMQESVEISMKLLDPEIHATRLETWLMEQPRVSELAMGDNGNIRLAYPGDRHLCADLLTRIVTAGFPIIEFRPVLLSMEEVFMQITESEITE